MTKTTTDPEWVISESRQELFTTLAGIVAAELASAIAEQGQALLAVSGGNTPAPFHRLLSEADLNWSRVTVTLTDERLVDETDERSNARMVRETLLQNKAAAATFVPLWRSGLSGKALVAGITSELASLLPVDVCIAGMGEDCHTASLFPGSEELSNALFPVGDAVVAAVTPPGGLEPRLTLTGPVLKQVRHRHLLIAGIAKRAAFTRAEASESLLDAPVRILLTGETALKIHYAP